MTDENIRVLIVDDHMVVRTGLSALIESEEGMEVAGEASNGSDGVEKAKQLHPDVILMDLVMPHMDGIEAISAIKKEEPEARILVLTSFSDEEKVIPAISAGASGYILKDSSHEELIKAIRAIKDGKPFLHPSIARLLMADKAQERKVQPRASDVLTDREIEVLKLVAMGLSNQAIADKLVVSENTVRYHVASIFKKFEFENRTQAALYAIREGLVTL